MEVEKKVNLIIADDHPIFRDGLKSVLKKIPFVGQLYQCENGRDVIELLEKVDADFVLLDVEMPVLNGVDTVKWIKENRPEVKIIILTMFNNQRYVMELYDLGVTGYLLKNTNLEELTKAIKFVIQGDNYFCAEAQETIFKNLVRRDKVNVSKEKVDKISKREMEILKLICEQFSTDEISEMLFISPLTVKRHRQILMEKTDSKNLAGLVVFSIKNDIYRIY